MRVPPFITRHLRPTSLLCAALTLALIVLFLRPVLFMDGWPQNHEGLRNFHRTAIYAAHLERGDLIPLWADSVALGYGGPFPAYYHRLFYYVSSVFHLVGWSLKSSLLLATGTFALIGLWGMQRLVSRIWPIHPIGALLAASAGLFTNYGYTVWIVRGAVAEFAAMMLLPWGFIWCLRLLEGESPAKLFRFGLVFFPLLYLAHSVIFFYFAGPVLSCIGIALWRRSDWRTLLGGLLGIGFGFALVALPTVYLQYRLGDGFGFAEGISDYLPQKTFRPLTAYFFDHDYAWGQNWEAVSVALDRPAIFAASLALIIIPFYRVRFAKNGIRGPIAETPSRSVEGLLIGMTGYYIFWQTPAAQWIYEHVPGFSYLQFPWRLLTYLSLLLPLLAWCGLAHVANRFTDRIWTGVFGAACAGIAILASPWTAPMQVESIRHERMNTPYSGYSAIKVGFAEYMPLIADVDNEARVARMRSFSPRPWHRSWTGAGVAVERVDSIEFESGYRSYEVKMNESASVAFPTAFSPYIRVSIKKNETSVSARAYRTEEDPRLQLDLDPGEYTVEFRYPTLWNLVFH